MAFFIHPPGLESLGALLARPGGLELVLRRLFRYKSELAAVFVDSLSRSVSKVEILHQMPKTEQTSRNRFSFFLVPFTYIFRANKNLVERYYIKPNKNHEYQIYFTNLTLSFNFEKESLKN